MKKKLQFHSDEALVEALRSDMPAAFEALYRRYYRMVAKQVTDQGRNDIDAEDIFQELLFILVGKIRKADFQLTAKLSTFLFAIARNLIYKKAGKKAELSAEENFFTSLNEPAPTDTLDDRKIWEEKLNVVVGHLELMEEDCRRLLRLSFYEKRSQVEISTEMGYSESYVKVKKHRCLNYLRSRVQEHPLFKNPPK